MINMKVTIIMFLVVNYLSTQSVGKRMVFQNGKWKFVGKLPENATITVFHNFWPAINFQKYHTIGRMKSPQKVVIY